MKPYKPSSYIVQMESRPAIELIYICLNQAENSCYLSGIKKEKEKEKFFHFLGGGSSIRERMEFAS